MRITINAQGSDGTTACLLIKTDVPWVAFDKKNIKKMKKFKPYHVFHINIDTDEASLYQPIP